MKTIFDTLDLPEFRRRSGAFLGKRDLSTLKAWIEGYITACEDAGEERRLETPNGLSIALLRDYIACEEQDAGVGGIDEILLNAADGQEPAAWVNFFAHLDAFEALRVQNVQTMQITEEQAQHAEGKRLVFSMSADGKWEPYAYRGLAFRKAALNEDICWITQSRPGEGQDKPFFGNGVVIMTQEEVDEQITAYFGEVNWKTEREQKA